ncbi:hypothetical protein C7212DRAFT_343918 [Tuber magnatum]|uniref:Uncharacterized protein n=1 Tax=Tuber magnatum TaxID=42249 RepID=A0A317SUU6_9PEZI|nr:hypothetical protein C7212DRAFT_343918 [Tuber magnatum]
MYIKNYIPKVSLNSQKKGAQSWGITHASITVDDKEPGRLDLTCAVLSRQTNPGKCPGDSRDTNRGYPVRQMSRENKSLVKADTGDIASCQKPVLGRTSRPVRTVRMSSSQMKSEFTVLLKPHNPNLARILLEPSSCLPSHGGYMVQKHCDIIHDAKAGEKADSGLWRIEKPPPK